MSKDAIELLEALSKALNGDELARHEAESILIHYQLLQTTDSTNTTNAKSHK